MQVGRTSLTPEEREHSAWGEPLSLLWPGGSLHLQVFSKRPDSPVAEELLVSRTSELSSTRRPLCHARLLLSDGSHTLATFIDSGCDVSLLDKELARQLGISCVPLPEPVPATALDSHLLGTVTHQTVPVRMLLSGNQHETIQFHILQSPHLPLILGYPWPWRHNPIINWKTGVILGWSPSCHQVCLKQASVPQPATCSRSEGGPSRVP